MIHLKVLNRQGATDSVTITPSSSPPWTLTSTGLGGVDETIQGETLFDALLGLRRKLEDAGYKLICAGARRNVYPSGMARSMGSARLAYAMEIGKSAHELVDIFDEAEPGQVGTVAEQEQYRQLWISSLRAKLK